MHSGVVIFPRREIAEDRASGMYFLAPIKYSDSATASPRVAGFKNIDLTDIYFLSFVRQNTPTEKTSIFIEITYTEE